MIKDNLLQVASRLKKRQSRRWDNSGARPGLMLKYYKAVKFGKNFDVNMA